MKTIQSSWRATALLILALAGASQAQVLQSAAFRLLYTFQKVGGVPLSIVEASPGRFIGVTGVSPLVYAIDSAGNYKSIYMFANASAALFPLTPALNGKVYGSAASSGNTSLAELFSVDAKGRVVTVPYNGATQGTPTVLAQSPDLHLYTFFGTKPGNPGVFTRLDRDGQPTSLYSFPASQGVPEGPFFLGLDGNFYGLALMNNTADAGIFRLTPSGSFSWVLPSFPTGAYGVTYLADLIQASNGNFYGTLPQGGAHNAGIIYEVTMDGKYRTVYEYTQPNTGIPETLLEASDGLIYGTTRGFFEEGQGYGGVFRLDPKAGPPETLYKFINAGNGECECRFVQGSDGKLYVAASNAGTYQGGTIFSLDLGLPKPQPHVRFFAPSTGAAGQKILIWGRGFLGTTAVSFNGTSAAFEVGSTQGVWATVPANATTGPITVTTAGGAFTSAQVFTAQ